MGAVGMYKITCSNLIGHCHDGVTECGHLRMSSLKEKLGSLAHFGYLHFILFHIIGEFH